MERLIVKYKDQLSFEIDPVTLKPKTCTYYEALHFSGPDPKATIKYIDHADWRKMTKEDF
jgi:hypothetical protein